VVTFGVGGWYPQGVERLRKSLDLVGFGGGLHTRSDYPPGCPEEKEVRKAFKPYLLKEAEAQGYRRLLWLDASIWAVRPLDKLFEMIGRVGWHLIDDGWNTGQWTCDSALDSLGITREESWDIWHLASGIVGLNLGDPQGKAFLDDWFRMAKDGTSFIGPRWSPSVKDQGHGDSGFCSTDDRVLGHRADQTAASVISWKRGMVPVWKKAEYSYLTWERTEVPKEALLVACGGVRPTDLDGVPYG
jgi:hypothetical protein